MGNASSGSAPIDPSKLKCGTPVASRIAGRNTLYDIFDDDVDMIDHNSSTRLPPYVVTELERVAEGEAARKCYEVEKIMARCIQDKMHTAWKCQKERDSYYECLSTQRKDSDIMTKLRWKYCLGTFHGEVVARRKLMNAWWNEHFPDAGPAPHKWAQEKEGYFG